MISFQGSNNKKEIDKWEKDTGLKFISGEVFKGTNNNHKFKPGEKAILFGLEDYPEFNGETITITSIRKDGRYGKAYYFNSDNQDLLLQLNWTYEYRLNKVT